VKTEAETGVMLTQDKEHLGLLEGGQGKFSPLYMVLSVS
jgi:hypothetical protein